MALYMADSQMVVLAQQIPSKYCQVFDLPPQYVTKAIELSKLFDKAIGSDLKFSLVEANEIARGAKLNVQKQINLTISQSNTNASQLFARFILELKSNYGIILSNSLIDQASLVFTYAFSNLYEEHRDAWIFWSEDHGFGKSYQYRTLYATTANIDGGLMLTFIPLSLTVSVDVVTEHVLCDVRTTMNSRTVTQGMVVTETFRAFRNTSLPVGATTTASFVSIPAVGTKTIPNICADALYHFKEMGYSLVKTIDLPIIR